MSEYGLVIFDPKGKQVGLKFGSRCDVRHLHQHISLFAPGQQVVGLKPIFKTRIQHILCRKGYVSGYSRCCHIQQQLPMGILKLGFGIGIGMCHYMRSSREGSKTQFLQTLNQIKTIRSILGAIVHSRQQMGMDICAEKRKIGNRFTKKVEHGSGLTARKQKPLFRIGYPLWADILPPASNRSHRPR